MEKEKEYANNETKNDAKNKEASTKNGNGKNKPQNSKNKPNKNEKSFTPHGKLFKDGKHPEIPGKNDYTYYVPDEQIAKDAASIPFNYIGGAKYEASFNVKAINSQSETKPTVAEAEITSNDAIVTAADIRYVPSIGVTDSINKGSNMAFRQLYAYIRKNNSGAKNYEVPDLSMFVLSMEDIYRQFFECKRDYGMYDRYSFYNHNIPYVFAAACRFDYNDLIANAANYRRRLNSIALRINSYAIPKYFNSFKRKAFISSYVFSDSTSARGQFYIFNSAGHYVWSPRTSELGTELKYVHHDSEEVITLGEKLDRLEAMLEAITQDEDATTISGDILKAFPESELYVLSMTDENYFTEIIYDEDVLGQIENMVCLCSNEKEFESFEKQALQQSNYPEFDFNIKQRNQLIISKPQFLATYSTHVDDDFLYLVNHNNYVFNSHKDNPDYKDVLEWSRLMTTSDSEIIVGDSDNELIPWTATQLKKVRSCGLEIPLILIMYQGHYADGNFTYDRTVMNQVLGFKSQDSNNDTAIMNQLRSTTLLMQMDWHPVIYLVNYGVTSYPHPVTLGFDSKVTTLISKDVLDRINDTAIYGCYYAKSLFNPVKH